jgi:hypothetical protein
VRLWIERLNGVPNAVRASGPPRCVVPDFARFQRVAQLLQVAQDRELVSVHVEDRCTEVSGPVPACAITDHGPVEAAKSGMEYRLSGDGKTWVLVRKQRALVLQVHPLGMASPEVAELEQLLNLIPGQCRYDIRVANRGDPDPLLQPTPPNSDIDFVPRSSAQVFFYLSNGVEVPPEHLSCGLVRPAVDAEGKAFDAREVTRDLFEVHVATGHKCPKNAYIAVHYRGFWFYIDDTDQVSKTTFALILNMSRLDFGRQRAAGPLLTLPVGR